MGLKCDFFISYAHHDKSWVLEYLYSRLQNCEYDTGLKPEVFIDSDRETDNIPHGAPWKDALEDRIKVCSTFIPVFSTSYFHSDYCRWELNLAQNRLLLKDPALMFLPLVIDPHCKVPDYVRQYQSRKPTSHSESGWFEKFSGSLKIKERTEDIRLQFESPVSEATAGLTLPPVRVKAVTEKGASKRNLEIDLKIEGGELRGDVRGSTAAGVAEFTNLTVAKPGTGLRLVASSPGVESVSSRAFDVLAPPAARVTSSPPTIGVEGEAYFFGSGRAVLVIRPGAVGVYDFAGQPLLPDPGEIAFEGRLRFIRRFGSILVLVDWAGNVFLFDDAGGHRFWSFGQGSAVVPADAALDGSAVYIGFWSGTVFRVNFTDPPQQVLLHPPGVQALSVTPGRYYVADFNGSLAVYSDQKQLVNTAQLEPSVWLLRSYPDSLLAIGDANLHQIQTKGYDVAREEIPLLGITEVFADSAYPVLMNESGQGLRVTPNFAFRQRIRALPGCVPVSADDAGRYCVLANPDGTRTLLYDDRVIFNHAEGTLAVSGAADRFALGEPGGIRLLTVAAFKQCLAGNNR